ncbi:hypothetical protein JP0123_12060 [Helicobacter pylori]|nr:hypothetical protein JP0123_12060 [Helicobacter pylori]
MKKFIKMLSYSKEGRNIKRLLLLPSPSIIQKKKKKRCYLSFIFNIFFLFYKMKYFLNLFSIGA